MFSHIFKYKFKYMLSDKIAIFWTLVFPILLSTLFNLAFANLSKGEAFEDVHVAIVNSENANAEFLSTIEKTDLFIVSKTDKDTAETQLAKGKISGYITCGDELSLTVSKSGINETIIKSFLDNYSQLTSTVTNVATNNHQGINEEFMKILSSDDAFTKESPINTSNNPVVIYFYALLAMTCLMSATVGADDIVKIQPNQSHLAARIGVAPTHKLKIFLASVTCTILFQFASALIVLAYIKLILKVDFGASIGYIILLCFISCFTGVMLGAAISSVLKKSQNVKTAIILAVVMLGCFLSGLMIVDMKYIVQDKAPILAYINPANLITDGFYSLYYYTTFDRYFLNLGILSGMGILFTAITYFVLRRQKYASI